MQDQGDANWFDAKDMVNDTSKHDANGAKFNDWRLPTKDELNLIYKQKDSIGGFPQTGLYWSSTTNSEITGKFPIGESIFYYLNIGDGSWSNTSQEFLKFALRAVRNF